MRKFDIEPILYRPGKDEVGVTGLVFPTTAFDLLNVGTDDVPPCEKLIRVLAAQLSHKVLDGVAG